MSRKYMFCLVFSFLVSSMLAQIPFVGAPGGLKFFSQSTNVLMGTEITSYTETYLSDDVWYQIDTVKYGVFSTLNVEMIFNIPLIEPDKLMQISVFSEAHIKNGTVAGYIRIYNYASASWEDCFPVSELSDTGHSKTLTNDLTNYINNGQMKLQTFFYGYPQSFFQDYTYIQLTTKPHASFTYTPTIILVNRPVTFNASESYDLDGTIISYVWDMGDSTILNGVIVTHTYEEMGNFTVILTVTDDDGFVDITSMSIRVRNSPPTADFSFSPATPVVGETVTFNASLSTPDGGILIRYLWDFGDGSNGTGVIVTHVYEYSEIFNVTLTVIDSEGLNATLTRQIAVFTRNIAITSLTPSSNRAYAGQIVALTVGVKNYGNEPQTFNVTTFYGEENITIGTREISLQPFEMSFIIFHWNTSDILYKISYRLKAEATILPFETSTTDNVLINGSVKINLLGDANEDGIVNIRDASVLCLSWGAISGNPEYNVDVDFNLDGIVNILDASTIGFYWGQLAEPTFTVLHTVTWGGQQYHVLSKSNCTISNITYNGLLKQLSFYTSGPKGINAYCEITIPAILMSGPFTVLVDGAPTSFLIIDPNIHNFTIRFTHKMSIHLVQISGYVPPFRLNTQKLSEENSKNTCCSLRQATFILLSKNKLLS